QSLISMLTSCSHTQSFLKTLMHVPNPK
uniref:Uncharacterized protein n=1 Tax=Amphimedon queenslandica TaxID=400682 RepID=A0A1X7US46_AMPQE